MDSTKVNNNITIINCTIFFYLSTIKNDPHIIVTLETVVQISNVIFQLEANFITHSKIIIMFRSVTVVYIRIRLCLMTIFI